jgi:type I restriction enzyme S subunit
VSFKPYPKYKESGVEWLGRLPEHWEVKRLKQVARTQIRNGVGAAADSAEEGNPRYVRITDIKGPRALHDDTFRSLPPEVAKDAAFQVGDVLFACVGATFGKSYLHVVDIGSVCYAGYLARFSPATNCEPRFIGHWAESASYWSQLNANVIQSTVQNFSASKYSELWIAVPSKAEQASVSDFLDHETAKIDALIAEQQRLIELLQEKRQAVISHAVTKGLNPNAPMKDSGIEWLGEVPEHWDASKPKHLTTKIVDGVHFKPEYVSEGVPFVTVQNLTAGDGISFDNLNYITPQAHEEYFRRANPEKGDVLLTKDGTLGVARVVDTDRVFSIFVSVALLKPIRDRLDPWFLRHAMESSVVFQQFKSGEQGSALKHIHLVDLRNVTLLLPPLEEQRSIVMALDVELDRLGALIEESRGAIALLQERRSALISAAVTGQIDVRGFTAGGSEDA